MFLKKSNLSLYLFVLILFFKTEITFSQTGIAINNTGASADVSAMLDVASTNKGFLLPRLTTTQRDLIGSPATGLVIFNSTLIAMQVNIGTPSVPVWSTLSTGSSGWGLTGNSGTNTTSNFLGTTDNNGLSIRTNSTQRIIVLPSGPVGIGVSAPTNPLVVKDTLEIARTGTLSELLFSNTAGTGDFRIAGDGGDIFWQGGGSRNLQMGSYWSTILTGDRQTTTFPTFSAGTGGTGVLVLSARNASIALAIQANSTLQTGNLTEWRNSSGTALTIVDKNGKIGINNTAPAEYLDVNGNVRFSGALMPNNSSGISGYLLASSGAGTAPVWTNPATIQGTYGWLLGGNAVSSLQNFGTTTNYAVPVITNNVERMRVDVNGNVGIGTTSPSAALNVVKNSSGTNVITIQNTNTGGFSSMDFYNASGALSSTFGFANSTAGGIFTNRAYMNSYGNDFVLTRNSGEYNIFIEGATGNVGIGTNTPGAKLDVGGNLKFSGALMPNNLPGTSGYILKSNGAGTPPTWVDPISLIGPSATSWLLTGNSGLTDNTNNYLGTNDNVAINFRYGGNKAGRIDAANAFFGSYAGYQNVNGSTLNTGMGYHALFSNTQGTRNTAIGYGALQNNTGSDNIGVGYAAETNATTNSIAIGRNTNITANYGIAIGDAAQTATNTYATAIGASTYATGNNSVSLGTSAQSTAAYSLALGPNSYTSAPYSVALGQAAQTNTNNYAIAIGTNSYSSGIGSIAIGGAAAANKVQALGTNSLSIGNSSYSGGTNAIAIGVSSNTTGSTSAIAIGASSYGGGTNAVALGTSASANGNYNTAIGPSSIGNGINSTALGYNSTANGNNSTAIGYNANAVNANTIVIGDAANTSLYTGLGIATPLYKLHVVAPSNPLFLAGVNTGASTDSILTISNGVVRKLNTGGLSLPNAWSTTGNAGTNIPGNFLGTTDNTSFSIRTNNKQVMLLDSIGNVAIGLPGLFTGTPNQEKLLVDAGTGTSVNVISGKGNIDSYLQLNIQNRSGGSSASSDVVATADNGDEFSNFVDMGINSSGNTSGFFGNANDAYFYAAGNDFIIGNGTANKSLIFLTNGGSVSTNERMRILSNGNIGIANAAPTQKLDVTGNIRFSGALMPNNLPGTSGYLLTSSGAGIAPVWSSPSSVIAPYGWALGGNAVTSLQNFGTTTNYAVPVITNNVERMRIDVNGNVGIGTTSPSAALHVIKNSTGTNVITIQNTNASGFSSMDFYNSAGTLASTFGFANPTSGGIFSNRAYMNSYGNDFVLTRNSGEYSIFIEGASGNVGIGTNTPGTKLDISGNVKFSGALMPNNLPGTSGFLLTSSGAGVAPVWTNPATIQSTYGWALGGNALTSQQNFGTTTNYPIPFITNNTEKMRLTTAGFLGIGTTSPLGKFHLVTDNSDPADDYIFEDYGAANTQGFYLRKARGTVAAPANLQNGDLISWLRFAPRINGAFSFSSNAGMDSYYKGNGTTDLEDLRFVTSSVERVRIDENGNVGVGTTAPAALLDVNGSVSLGPNATVTKNIVNFTRPLSGTVPTIPSSLDVILTIPAAANYLTSTQASVTVSPSADLPTGILIAFARMISTSQVKIRFLNGSGVNQTLSGNIYVNIVEF